MSGERTEKPTQQKLKQARDKGQFPAAKELVNALQFLVLVFLITRSAQVWFTDIERGFQAALRPAFRAEWTASDLIHYSQGLVVSAFLPLGITAALLFIATVAFQMGVTNFGLHLGALAPDFSRLNPLSRLKQITKQNLPQALQALVLMLLLLWIVHSMAMAQLPTLLTLTLSSARTALGVLGELLASVLWKSAIVLLFVGLVQGFRQRMSYEKGLRMSKEEIRREMKDSDGDPHIKARVRRLRRELLRKRMMQDVPTATAIIVNPTHYAVAIRYDPKTMASPKVVAKGRNYLAARIREIAREHNVMIVENPPLARALYGSVEVGQDIPPDFYRAIAEVLAYVYRISGHRNIPG
ncbi:MAG: EscU/YscU/HrcU family type III secretion system export apparatus switch protein [Bryobacteraceae bacterium]|nr:EscU/YscU/HrcU family type III secretion system export apparatus switch protein [Bryobacteraceae bacterium]